jgi:1-acyl-sn-glycerol-3-phosphate acyltransferase
MQRWCRALCRAFAIDVKVSGPLPPRGALVVANHLSYLDIIVLGGALPITFVSKAEVADWPVIGALARQFDTLFLVRERKRDLPAVNAALAAALRAGDGVVVFPEGTSTRGDDVLEFRAALLAPAAELALDVWPASLSYRTYEPDPPASLSVCWWGDMQFAPHVRDMVLLERVAAEVVFTGVPERDSQRKLLAEKLHRAVKSRFRPIP